MSGQLLLKRLQGPLDTLDKRASHQIFAGAQKLMPRLKPLLIALEWSCNGLVWLALTILVIVCNIKPSSLGPKLLVGLIVDIFCVAISKALARRRRPTYAYQRDQMIVSGLDKHSFPSGHCSRAAFVALFLSLYTGSALGLLTTLWACSVCVSRVLLGRHYIFDCLAGASLGWINYQLNTSILPLNLLFSDPNDMDGTDALTY